MTNRSDAVAAGGDASADVVDVVVVGSGAAALTAAITSVEHGATVKVVEKADQVGGTSAWSGGMIWIPCNPHMEALGISDSREEALTYLASLSHGTIEPALAAAFVDTGPEMVRFMEERTPVRFQIIEGFPDYHPENPGGKPKGGRSLETPLFPFEELGPWAERVMRGKQLTGALTMGETPLGRGAPNGVSRDELARRRIHDERGCGQSLIGMLLRGCLDRGIEPVTGARATSLIVEDGRVCGVTGETGETATGAFAVRARGGVVLATGGFEWNPELVRSFVRGPLERPVSVPTNTGDGLKMAMRAGASLGNMREAWWLATIDVDDANGEPMAWQVNGERTRPHCIMVNRSGRRFANEAANYNAFGAAFHQIDVTTYEYANLPCWMVFDHWYLSRYGLAGYRGEGPVPRWMVRADSLDALAAELGIDAAALDDNVARWNACCDDGVDVEFGRGRSAHDTWWGDPEYTGHPNATLGPIDTAPYYAVQVRPGALGTKGGPRTDENAQVLDLDGQPLPGLYAAGNVMASVMGMTYGGAGGTLGPAMVFGYLAGRHAARSARRS
jgi:succinate dehydrogenase/fumarate reductase flavoprotein subunit